MEFINPRTTPPARMGFFIAYCILFLLFAHSQAQDALIKGNILNYANQPVSIYKCYGDTLLLAESTQTDKKGGFTFFYPNSDNVREGFGVYKVVLQKNQFFYILNDGNPIEIKTTFPSNFFYNIATDSLKVLKSEENKRFYEFQNRQQELNVANYFLLQMMRLYPLPDPFHQQIEDEYFKRHKVMEQFVKKIVSSSLLKRSGTDLLAIAYYQPILPDWKQPDDWRDSIIALHYFDYFNPADSFYLFTNILPEKIDTYLALKTNKRDAYGQPVYNEMFVKEALQEFLEKTKSNRENFDFCLNYVLEKLNQEKQFTALLEIYDMYVKPETGDCESGNRELDWVRKKASVLRNIQIGSIAPDFEIEKGKLSLSSLQSDYTLLIFWATWCPHCLEEMPKIKDAVNNFNSEITNEGKKLLTVAVSLDTDKLQWQKFITENNLSSFLNFSEFKGWNGNVSKQYNVYATPTLFLLDKEKKIISKPINAGELHYQLTEISKK